MNFYYYIKTALKTLLRNKAYSFINILGLSVGLSLVIIILLIVKYELNYDTHFPQSKNIYRLVSKSRTGPNKTNDALTPMPLLNLVDTLPQTVTATRFIPGADKLITYRSSDLNENRFFFSDSSFFRIFDLKIIEGSLKEFGEPGTVIISSSTANRYFPEANPVGKTIVRGGVNYRIVAVSEDMPDATHFHFNFIASISTIDEKLSYTPEEINYWKNNWFMLSCYTYIKVKPGTDANLLEETINKQKELLISKQKDRGKEHSDISFALQPITSIHLHSDLNSELETVSNPVRIFIFIFIALFILFITSINFINITTAKHEKRIKDAAIRKTFGARRYQILIQIITEAFIISATSTLLGLVLAELISPYFNTLFGLNIHIYQIHGLQDIGIVILITFIAGIFSGLYPAIFFSEIKISNIFKQKYKINKLTFNVRGIIVAGHVFVVLFLSVLTAGIWWQTNFIQNKDLGFNKKNILILEREFSVKPNYDELKKELKSTRGIRNVSAAMSIPGKEYIDMKFSYKGEQQNQTISIPINYVDCDYLETMGLRLNKGTFFNCHLTDSMGIILNSAAIMSLKIRKPLEEHLEITNSSRHGSWNINIIGVLNDYNYEPLTKKVQPLGLMLLCQRSFFRYIIIELDKDHGPQTMQAIQTLWSKYSGNSPMESFFLDDKLNDMYKQDFRMLKAVLLFTIFSYFISILGFISLASFLIEFKKKRISFLRTTGTPDIYILKQIIGSYSKFVITAISLSIPLAIFTIKIWLKDYAYFETMPAWLYFMIVIIVITTGSLSVVIQYFKTVNRNNKYYLLPKFLN